MIRLTLLLLTLLANRHWLWNAGTLDDGAVHVWAGTLYRFDFGPHLALTWDDDGLEWCTCWCDRQDPADEFYAWGWYAEGRVGGEARTLTP